MSVEFSGTLGKLYDLVYRDPQTQAPRGRTSEIVRIDQEALQQQQHMELKFKVTPPEGCFTTYLNRGAADKNANNTIRNIFQLEVDNYFGGNVPDEVKEAMNWDKFDSKGRPLTVRRIQDTFKAIEHVCEGVDPYAIREKLDSAFASQNPGVYIPALNKTLDSIGRILPETGDTPEHISKIRSVLTEMRDTAGRALAFRRGMPMNEIIQGFLNLDRASKNVREDICGLLRDSNLPVSSRRPLEALYSVCNSIRKKFLPVFGDAGYNFGERDGMTKDMLWKLDELKVEDLSKEQRKPYASLMAFRTGGKHRHDDLADVLFTGMKGKYEAHKSKQEEFDEEGVPIGNLNINEELEFREVWNREFENGQNGDGGMSSDEALKNDVVDRMKSVTDRIWKEVVESPTGSVEGLLKRPQPSLNVRLDGNLSKLLETLGDPISPMDALVANRCCAECGLQPVFVESPDAAEAWDRFDVFCQFAQEAQGPSEICVRIGDQPQDVPAAQDDPLSHVPVPETLLIASVPVDGSGVLTDADRVANNRVRKALEVSLENMFGGQIPERVRGAMVNFDGSGQPLTAAQVISIREAVTEVLKASKPSKFAIIPGTMRLLMESGNAFQLDEEIRTTVEDYFKSREDNPIDQLFTPAGIGKLKDEFSRGVKSGIPSFLMGQLYQLNSDKSKSIWAVDLSRWTETRLFHGEPIKAYNPRGGTYGSKKIWEKAEEDLRLALFGKGDGVQTPGEKLITQLCMSFMHQGLSGLNSSSDFEHSLTPIMDYRATTKVFYSLERTLGGGLRFRSNFLMDRMTHVAFQGDAVECDPKVAQYLREVTVEFSPEDLRMLASVKQEDLDEMLQVAAVGQAKELGEREGYYAEYAPAFIKNLNPKVDVNYFIKMKQ